MSIVKLITFASTDYTISAQKLVTSAYHFGCTSAHIYFEHNISKEFLSVNQEIFDQPRGYGYWLWKPYLIYQKLLSMDRNEILMYSDAGVEIIADIHHVTDCMGDQDIFLFSNGWPHADWCKMDIMAKINNTTHSIHQTMSGNIFSLSEDMQTRKQVQASNIFLRVSDKSKRFVKEWLMYCQLPGLIDDSPSKLPNASTFAENRHDQAVLASLAIRDNIPLHWFPSETGMHLPKGGDNYPALFRHHRKRNAEW